MPESHPLILALVSYLEHDALPTIVLDTDYNILAANAAYRSQFSPRASVVGRTCYEVSHHFSVPCDQAGESCPLARARESGQRERVLHLHHSPNGEQYVNIELTPLPGEDGQPAFFVEKMEPLRVAQGRPSAQGLIGRSEAFQRMLALVARVAPSRASVLLLGESGTGKELVARALHGCSHRASGPFVAVNCGAIPESLIEAEFFGVRKGAYTGASQDREGYFQAAHGGTLFLDEIGNLPLPLQAKLLAALQNRQVTRVGANRPVDVNIRLISATNMPVYNMVYDNSFRQDLLYRINTIEITLPPLRERVEDIPLLADHFISYYSKKYNKDIRKASEPLLKRMTKYHWPGNIRELQHSIERAVIMSNHNVLQPEDLFLQKMGQPEKSEENVSLEHLNIEDVERILIRKALQKHNGHITRAAEELGLTRSSRYRRLEKYGL